MSLAVWAFVSWKVKCIEPVHLQTPMFAIASVMSDHIVTKLYFLLRHAASNCQLTIIPCM